MWDNELSSKIAAVLQLMAHPPNLRREEGIKVFDGGRLIEDTGLTTFELADGTEAFYGSGQTSHLTIKFPSGCKVEIDVTEASVSGETTRIGESSTEFTPPAYVPVLCPLCDSAQYEEVVEDFQVEMPDLSILVVPQIPVLHCSVCQARWLSPCMSDAVDEFVRRGGTWRTPSE